MKLENLFRVLAVLGLEIQEVWPAPLQQGPVKKVTSSFIRQSVEAAEKRRPKPVGYDDILRTVCKLYGVSQELCSPSRRGDLSEARTVATVLVREQRHLKLVELSRLLKRDVSSLGHCLRLQFDSELEARIRESRQQVTTAKASQGTTSSQV